MIEINKEIEKINLKQLYPKSYTLLLQYQSKINPDDIYDILTKWFSSLGISIVALPHHSNYIAAIKLQKENYFVSDESKIILSNVCDSKPEISHIKGIEKLFEKLEEKLQKEEEI